MDLLVIRHGETVYTVDADAYAEARDTGTIGDLIPLDTVLADLPMSTLLIEPDGTLTDPGNPHQRPHPSLIGPTPLAALAETIAAAPPDPACPLCTTTACPYHIATHLGYMARAQQLVIMPIEAADRVVRSAVRNLL